VMDALNQGVHARCTILVGLVTHSDAGSQQYLSIRYSERLADNAIVASVGSKGDSYDNALRESFNGLYKWELIYRQGPWRGLDDVEFATMTYVDWFNHRRLHGEITNNATYTTPNEFEAAYYTQNTPRPPGTELWDNAHRYEIEIQKDWEKYCKLCFMGDPERLSATFDSKLSMSRRYEDVSRSRRLGSTP
jgi:hypothetical protein